MIAVADIFNKEKRSEIMSKIRGKDTKIEILIRKRIWAKGIRYRIHCRGVPGTPDICSKTRRIAVFLDGCFWHGCPRCSKKLPETNKDFWRKKIEENRKRRKKVLLKLREEGYKVLQFWECEIKEDPDGVAEKIAKVWENQSK